MGCRYHFPRLPCSETIVARPIGEHNDLKDMTEEQLKNFKKDAKEIVETAKMKLKEIDLGNDPSLHENMSLEEFCLAIKPKLTVEEYMKYIKITEKGTVLMLKRDVKDRNVNNYNPEMLYAWNANMDIQLALDPFAVITYIVNYMNKDETGMTKFMAEALRTKATAEASEKLNTLKLAYLSNRQVGASEAVYRVLPGMRLKDSNISTIFVPSGFPENRSVFYQKVVEGKDEEIQDSVNDDGDDVEPSAANEDGQEAFGGQNPVEIAGRSGKFVQATTIIDRYEARPDYLDVMCLAQFSISYIYMGKLPKGAQISNDLDNDEFNCSSLKSDDQKIFNQEKFLPKYIALTDGLGFMRLRSYPSVLRIHDSRKKDQDHEKYYSELLLFSHWKNEQEDIPSNDEQSCQAKYLEKREEMEMNRFQIYPGESTIDLLESAELELVELEKPVHLADILDTQGEQENDDDLEVGPTEDPAFESFGYTGNLNMERPPQFLSLIHI